MDQSIPKLGFCMYFLDSVRCSFYHDSQVWPFYHCIYVRGNSIAVFTYLEHIMDGSIVIIAVLTYLQQFTDDSIVTVDTTFFSLDAKAWHHIVMAVKDQGRSWWMHWDGFLEWLICPWKTIKVLLFKNWMGQISNAGPALSRWVVLVLTFSRLASWTVRSATSTPPLKPLIFSGLFATIDLPGSDPMLKIG